MFDGYGLLLPAFVRGRAPGGGTGTTTALVTQRPSSGLRLPGDVSPATVQGFGRRAGESGCPTPEPFLTATKIESPLARNGPQGLSHLRIPSPFPWRRNACAWDCKVTPLYCTCQEGNTIGCIPSNDGLDARLGVVFPHDIKIPRGYNVLGLTGFRYRNRETLTARTSLRVHITVRCDEARVARNGCGDFRRPREGSR